MASANNHLAIAQLLLKNGANPNSINQAKNTPLRNFFYKSSKLLIFNTFFSNIDWAALNGRLEII